jgi:signal transduction histidine kinase
MRLKTWPVATVALAGLLALIVFSVLVAARRAENIYSQMDAVNAHHRNVERTLRLLRADVHSSAIYIRDYLLDADRSAEHRVRLAALRESANTAVTELRRTMPSADAQARIARLEAQLMEYWSVFDPLFTWTPAEDMRRSGLFVRSEVLPRREAVLAFAKEVEELNDANLAAERTEILARQSRFRSDLYNLLWLSLLLGGVVAVTAIIRLRALEKTAVEQRLNAEQAEHQMRSLSQQLVALQEEERRKLSRELHDHVGQMLTALRMELGRVDRVNGGADGRITGAVQEARQLVDTIVGSVRDISMGLRPSMLDDFGLGPALEWHVRDVERHSGLRIQLEVSGDIDRLSDRYRTCVYRSVQEALTNCVRHARAARVHVVVKGWPDHLVVSVSDDGVGIDPAKRRGGLGLLGIEERVRELGGTMNVESSTGAGTTLAIHLPIAVEKRGAPRARAAG